jgi:hypothetical protein
MRDYIVDNCESWDWKEVVRISKILEIRKPQSDFIPVRDKKGNLIQLRDENGELLFEDRNIDGELMRVPIYKSTLVEHRDDEMYFVHYVLAKLAIESRLIILAKKDSTNIAAKQRFEKYERIADRFDILERVDEEYISELDTITDEEVQGNVGVSWERMPALLDLIRWVVDNNYQFIYGSIPDGVKARILELEEISYTDYEKVFRSQKFGTTRDKTPDVVVSMLLRFEGDIDYTAKMMDMQKRRVKFRIKQFIKKAEEEQEPYTLAITTYLKGLVA